MRPLLQMKYDLSRQHGFVIEKIGYGASDAAAIILLRMIESIAA